MRPPNAFPAGAILSMALAPLVSAVPSVTVVPLDNSCSSYPEYDASTGVAGPWLVEANSTGSDIDGHSDTSVSGFRAIDGKAQGYITIPVDNQLAKTPLRCTDDELQAVGPSKSDRTFDWQPLIAVTSTPESASLGFGFNGTNSPILPYAHYIDGVQQDGVFLGADGITTWAFSFDSPGEYYAIRLLGPNSGGLKEGEFDGFLKA